jgi:hypothetical protein
MNSFFTLLRLQLNARFGFSTVRYNYRNNKKEFLKAAGQALVVFIAIAELFLIYAYVAVKVHEAAKLLDSPQLIITLAAASAGLLIFFFGIFYILSALFLAKDAEFLASLPVSQSSVFMSKFALVLLGEYPVAAFFMLPPVIIYGTAGQKGITYYIAALICILLIPAVPLLISSLLALCLMNIVSRARRRDAIIIAGSVILMLAVFIGENLLLSRIPGDGSGTEFLAEILQRDDGLVEWAGRIFPPAVWITRALSRSGAEAFENLVRLVVLSVACFVPVWLLAGKIYQKGATAQLEAEKRTVVKKLIYKSSSPLMAVFKNEWKIILRTPVYALNSLVGIIIGPVLMLMPLFGSTAQDPDMQAFYSFVSKLGSSPESVLIGSGILALFGSFNAAVSSTYSREGKSVWILKSIPVNPLIQAAGKLMAGYSISLLCILTTSLAMAFVFRMRFIIWLACIMISAASSFPACLAGMMIDMASPRLHWSNPNEAIKQNFNVFLGTLAGMAVIVILGAVCFGLYRLHAKPPVLFGTLAAVLAVMWWAGIIILKKAAVRMYMRLEG